MKIAFLLLALVATIGACGVPDPIVETDAGVPVICFSYFGPGDGGIHPGAKQKECEPGEICVLSETSVWVCAPGEAVICNSEIGATFLPPGVDLDQQAGYFRCFPGYRCLNPRDGTGFQCYPPPAQ